MNNSDLRLHTINSQMKLGSLTRLSIATKLIQEANERLKFKLYELEQDINKLTAITMKYKV